MREVMLSTAALCMMAAICEQIMDHSRFFRGVRMILGLQIISAFAMLLADAGIFRSLA